GTYILVKPPAPPSELMGVLRQEYRQLPPFELTTQAGEALNEQSIQGKWSFVFFGYLSCPDVCPSVLHEMNTVYKLIEDEAGKAPDNLQVMFISVDPGRDSAEQVGQYVRYFNQSFIGATAAQSAIDGLMRDFGAAYIIEAETAPGQYLVSHTSAIFLIDPMGRLVASFSQPHYATTIFSQYKKIKAYFSGAN
ncbi:MAG: SCO family protein, partial [Gammaproteobacteria bacterium]|nr:SCO family protein [Gammaproteobacteria bacterium]